MIAQVNRCAAQLFGAAPQSMMSTPMHQWLAESEETLHAPFFAQPGDGETESAIYFFRRSDGTPFQAAAHWGRLDGAIYLTLDAAPRNLQQKGDAKASQSLYLDIFNNALVGIYRTRISDGQLLECNRRLAEMFGYSSREVMLNEFRSSQHYVNPEDRARLLSMLGEHGTIDGFNAPMRRRDGSVRWFRYTGTLYPELGYLEGVAIDVTEEHVALEEVKLAASVFDGTTEGILITDREGRILRVNESFTRITGYTQEEVLLKAPSVLKSERHDTDFYKNLWHELLANEHWSGEIWNRRKDGELFVARQNISLVRDSQGEISQFIGIFTDITEHKQVEERIVHLAHYDALTDLPNRLLFQDRCEHAIDKASRDRSHMAVLFLDLDGFKDINDTLGHPIGDKVLKVIAERLAATTRREDTVARLGGDEFTMVVEELDSPQDAAIIAEKLLESLHDPIMVQDHQFHLTASIGISIYPDDGADTTTLVRNADTAMYRAKEQGRNGYQFYTRELTSSAFERVLLEGQLREALERGEFQLVYQPQIDLPSGAVIGVEALLRWHNPAIGSIPPGRFIPIAERSGLIEPIGAWVLEHACQQLRQWQNNGVPIRRMSVNISGVQLQRSEFVKEVERIVGANGINTAHLELEVTESFIMTHSDEAISALTQLRALGITLAVDDFGTGYSSLSYLKSLPIHRIKIDQSFVRDIPEDSNDEAITRAIIALSHNLQLQVIAEGVESAAQHQFLLNEGCDEAQGYYFGRPLPADQIPTLF